MTETALQAPKKKLVPFVVPQTTLWAVKFNTGGELPAELKGMFTSEKLAIKAMKAWHSKKFPVPKSKK